MDRPAAIVFDWDNTLVDSWGTIHEALNLTLAAMHHPTWTLAETKARTRLSLRDSFPRLFGEAWNEARRIYLENFERIHLDRLTALPDAKLCLERLREDGCYNAIVSNKTGRLLRREVDALGWNNYFSSVVGAGDAVADKPDRAPIDLALGPSGIAAGPCVWYVGDTGLDIVTAHRAGCLAVLLHSPATAIEEELEGRSERAHLVFDDFAGMIAALNDGGS